MNFDKLIMINFGTISTETPRSTNTERAIVDCQAAEPEKLG